MKIVHHRTFGMWNVDAKWSGGRFEDAGPAASHRSDQRPLLSGRKYGWAGEMHVSDSEKYI